MAVKMLDQVRVDDRREGAVVAVADGQGEAGAALALLAQPLVDQHVGVHGHAEHQHQAGQAGQREGGLTSTMKATVSSRLAISAMQATMPAKR